MCTHRCIEKTNGACLYVLAIDDYGLITDFFFNIKCRIAPIKPTKIPRLETVVFWVVAAM